MTGPSPVQSQFLTDAKGVGRVERSGDRASPARRLTGAPSSPHRRGVERYSDHTGQKRYDALIRQALKDNHRDPLRTGSRLQVEVEAGIRSYHLRHSRHRVPEDEPGIVGRPHRVGFHRLLGDDLVLVNRILHDAMEPGRHLADDAPPE